MIRQYSKCVSIRFLRHCDIFVDNLLCHDDELAGRRIAFILYLTPLWKAEDGGMLDLFDMDGEFGQTCSFE